MVCASLFWYAFRIGICFYVFECGAHRKVCCCGGNLCVGDASTSGGTARKEDWDVLLFLLVGELGVGGGKSFNGFAQYVLSGFSDNLFGRPAVFCEGVVAGVPVVTCSCLTPGGCVPIVV